AAASAPPAPRSVAGCSACSPARPTCELFPKPPGSPGVPGSPGWQVIAGVPASASDAATVAFTVTVYTAVSPALRNWPAATIRSLTPFQASRAPGPVTPAVLTEIPDP